MAGPATIHEVRGGGAALVGVLARAFADDPWLRWTLPDPGAIRQLFSLFLRRVALPHGRVLVARDDTGMTVGVAVLAPPGVETPEDPALGEMVMALHGRRLGPALDAEALVASRRDQEGAWVLHTLAVDPPAQRRGIGGLLLERALALAGPTPLTLETSNPLAREWYRRRGFVLTAEVPLPAGLDPAERTDRPAPTVWLLRHPGAQPP